MPNTTPRTLFPAFGPLRLQERSLLWQGAAIAIGTLFLTLSSWIVVPMIPVPVTMQTFAVTLVGALYGWRLGALTVVAWLAEAAVGMPVLAGGSGGLASFAGPTAGYLFSFPVIAALVGWLVERGWDGERVLLAFGAMLIGNGLCLVIGAAWLAGLVGFDKAVALGITPFIVGGVLKSALAAATLKLFPDGRAEAKPE